MKINSRSKGARGEREASKHWISLFPSLKVSEEDKPKRGQQRSGLEQADVVNVSDLFHIEVKRYKRFSIWAFIKQMKRDAKEGQVPVLMFRPDGDTDWHVAISTKDLVPFAEEIMRIHNESS